MNTFMDRVNAIVQQNQIPQAVMPKQEPVYPDAGIGALENVVSGAPRQTEIMGQPHMLAYINPQEEQMLRDAGGAGLPGPDGIPSYFFFGGSTGFGSWGDKVADAVSDTWSEITTGGNAVTDTYNSNDTSSQDIVSGDTVSQLALDNNTTIAQIKADNPNIDINNIKAGETINITSNTRNEGESIYTGVTQSELDAGNAMIASNNSTGGNNSTGSTTSSLTSDQQERLSGDLFGNYDALPSASTSGLTKLALSNGREYYVDEAGTFIGLVPEEVATPVVTASPVVTADDVAVAGSTYDDLDGALTTVTAGEDDVMSQTVVGTAGQDYANSLPDFSYDFTGGDTSSAENFTEIDDGDGTDFSVVSGDARDDLYFDLSDPSERLVTGNGVGFTGTYEGVTYTDGYEDKDPLKIKIVLGDDIGASIEDAVAASKAESDETVLTGFAGMSQNDFLNLSGSDVRVEEITSTNQVMQDLKDLTALEKAGYSLSDIENLTNAQIVAGLGRDVAAGFAQELALRIGGSKKMFEDVFGDGIDVSAGAIAGELFELGGGDFQPGSESQLELAIQSAVGQTELNKGVKGLGDSVNDMVDFLNEKSNDIFEGQSTEYKAAVLAGMPDPNNEGFNMLGEPFTLTNPGLWMASTAAQELLGLGLDVAAIVALGPVAGAVVGMQQGTAEAGKASADETKAELESLRSSGALNHLSDEEFNTVVDTAATQAFYTSGVAGGLVDTAVALTAGGFAPVAKALPAVVNSALTALGVLTAEGVSGGLEQVGVNAAVIKALQDQGIDPEDFDKGYLDQAITSAIMEVVGSKPAAVASTVGSAVQNSSAESDGESQSGYDDLGGALTNVGGDTQTVIGSTYDDLSGALTNLNTATASTGGVSTYDDLDGALTNVGGDTQTVIGSTYDDLGGALTNVGGEITQTNTQGVNTINTQAVTDAEGQTYTVDTAVDANGNTSVTVTNDATNESNTTDVGTGTFNSVNVGTGTSIIVDTSNTTDTNAVNTTVLEGGSSVTQTSADGVTGEETTVDDLTQTELDVIGAQGTDTTLTDNGDGSVTVANDVTGTSVVVGSGSDANIVDVVNAVQNDDISAVTGNGVTNVTGGSDTGTDVGALTNLDTTTGDAITGDAITGDATTGDAITGDATTGDAITGTGDTGALTNLDTAGTTTITANNDATVTNSTNGAVTVTTVTDGNGNATVTTNNSVTGETTTDSVLVNNTTTVTNGDVTIDVNAETDGTKTTVTEADPTVDPTADPTVKGIVDVGTVADAIVDAATTTTVEEPVVELPVEEPPVEEPLNPVADSLINTDNYAERDIYGDFQRRRRGGSGIGSPQYMRRYMSGRIIDEMVRRVENADGTVSYVTPDGRYLNPKDFINTAALGDIESLKIGSERYQTGTTTTNLTTGETTTTNTT